MMEELLRQEWANSTSYVPYTLDRIPTDDHDMTKGSLVKVSSLGNCLKGFLELVKDEKALHTIFFMIDHCAQVKEVYIENKVVN
jgi:hypothetical protein